MFGLHTAYSLQLLVLLVSISLIIWSMRNEGTKGAGTAKFFGLLVAILTALNMGCTLYYGITYWQQGAFKNATPMMSAMHEKMMMGNGMQGKGMMHGNMSDMDMHNEDKTNVEKASPSDAPKQ